MTLTLGLLEVYQAGELTVVGFGGREILEQVSLIEYRDELQSLIDDANCQTLAIDLTGVRVVPSGMLGILASIHGKGVEVQLFNAGEEICEVLAITKLDRLFKLHEVEV
ncbi:anti-sigma factor antagonist [bacterium]|nr:anti-sigma factor antagonist [bacterium]